MNVDNLFYYSLVLAEKFQKKIKFKQHLTPFFSLYSFFEKQKFVCFILFFKLFHRRTKE